MFPIPTNNPYAPQRGLAVEYECGCGATAKFHTHEISFDSLMLNRILEWESRHALCHKHTQQAIESDLEYRIHSKLHQEFLERERLSATKKHQERNRNPTPFVEKTPPWKEDYPGQIRDLQAKQHGILRRFGYWITGGKLRK